MKNWTGILMVVGGLFLNSDDVFAVQPAERDPLKEFDQRLDGEVTNQVVPVDRLAAVEHLRSRLPQAQVVFDHISSAFKFISAGDQFLTGTNGQGKSVPAAAAAKFSATDPYRITKAFLHR
jgi:hypothetical protein